MSYNLLGRSGGRISFPASGWMACRRRGFGEPERPVLSDEPSPLEQAATHRFVQLIVARAFGVTVGDLLATSRCGAHVAAARQVAMYLTHIGCQLSMTDVGRLYGRDRTTAAHACRRVEDRRDDPLFDMAMDALESVIRAWRQGQPLIEMALRQ